MLGVAVSTAVLVGALVIGDSVRYSLRQLVFDRLGQTEYAVQTGDRFFRTQLADELAEKLETPTAPLLHTRGIAIAAGGEYRVNRVQVLGVDARFGVLGDAKETYASIGPNEILINERLAQKLNASPGDELLMRLEKLDAMPQDAPLASDTDISVSKRFTIKHIVSTEQFGRFNLRNNQVEPYNAFVSLSALGQALELTGKANTLLIAARGEEDLSRPELNEKLADEFTMTDAGLYFTLVLDSSALELRSDRIFIEPSISHRINNRFENAQPIFTYFVNQFALGDRYTPYSFVASATTIDAPDLKENDMIINAWLANDLNARVGENIELTYFTLGPMRTLIEDTTEFRISKIVPLSGQYADGDLMPDFPGLADEENCRDWEAGFPINYDKIRDKDEQYWDDYRGTPKAFVSLDTAQRLWGNRFGNLTAIRFQDSDANTLEQDITKLLDPISLGFVFQPVREQGLEASRQSVSFSQLFIGLSFFLVVAALLLTGLLFVFNVEQRSQESGLLLAIGFPQKKTRRLILAEGLSLAVFGSLLGIFLGLLYHSVVLFALKTIWSDIVGTSALQLKINPLTILMGVLAGIVMSWLSMWLVARRHARRPITEQQKGAMRIDKFSKKKPVASFIIIVIAVLAVAVILLTTNPGDSSEASSAFFGAGALLLIAGLAIANLLLVRLRRKTDARLTLKSVGQRNNARRRLRSLTLIGVLAAGVFITFTVGANRTSPLEDADERSSGTGGFAFWGETMLPILHDLNSERGQDFYGFEKDKAQFVHFRAKIGDDASCLNLNRTTNPQILSVQPEELSERDAFSFAALTKDVDPDQPWLALNKQYDNNIIPGMADQTVIVWGLGKSVGDTLFYTAEDGREFGIRLVGGLANSIFQGNVIISEEHFIKKYASNSGYRVLLIDAPASQREELAQKLTWTFQDQGLDLTPSALRLAEFNKVTNTYLSIFMILGGLGLVLGSIGIGIVLLRNVAERRGELALLRAVGFKVASLQKLILSEHMVLLFAGIAIGALSALFAVMPSLLAPGTGIPYFTILFTLLAVIGSGILWTWLAAKLAMRGDLLSALRNE